MTDMCPGRHADMNAEPWEAAVAVRLPILLTGPGTTTDAWIHQMEARLALPVIDVACTAGVNTAALDDAGTVIFHDVEHLRPADQMHLLRWLEKAPHRPQIISTSSRALYPLVPAGRFSEDLYYRLNSVYLNCTNPTILDLLAIPDEDGWIEEFPAEACVQAAVRPPVPTALPSVRSTERTTLLAVTSCAFGVLIGAVSMWIVTQSQSVVVPIAGGARIQEGWEQPALSPRHDFTAATLPDSSARKAPSPLATIGQSEPAAPPRTLRRPAAPPRRTVFRGALAVNSRPTGARVSINGQSLGVTPLMVNRLPAGSRVVRVTAQGYHPWSSAVRVVANERNSVMATLQRLPN